MKKNFLKFLIIASALTGLFAIGDSFYRLGFLQTIWIFILMVIALFIGVYVGGISMAIITQIRNKPLEFHQKETEEEKTSFIVEKTPIYGLIIIANAIILFTFCGLIACISHTVFFGLAFASPWHKEVREIAAEWGKRKKED